MPVVRVIKLSDLAAQPVEVEITGGVITVWPIGARGWMRLLDRFPAMGEAEPNVMPEADMTPEQKALALQMMAAIVAEGLREHDNPDAPEIIADLPLQDQAALVQAITRASKPPGADAPLAEGVAPAPAAPSGKARATRSPRRSKS